LLKTKPYRNASLIAARLAERDVTFADLADYLRDSVQTVQRKATGERAWRGGQQQAVFAWLFARCPLEWAAIWPHQGHRKEEPASRRVVRVRQCGQNAGA